LGLRFITSDNWKNILKPSPRRKARELAVQAVYSWQISQNSVNDIEVNFIADNSKRRFDIEYFQLLLRGVTTDASIIDETISPFVDRPLDDIDHVEKAILRVAVFELKDCVDVPYRVVINEAIELAKSFAADDSHKFVNGVLDKAVKLVRSEV
jgi:N utilization substance protein B